MSIDRNEYRVLVIEDNKGDALLIEEYILEHAPKAHVDSVSTFCEGRDFAESAHTSHDVILLDLSLPDASGESLITEAVALWRSRPVIALTGYTDLEFSKKSMSLGVSDYLLKDELSALSLYKSILYSIERSKHTSALVEYVATIEAQNAILTEITWMQSHLVRAPLARIIGLVNLLFEDEASRRDLVSILGHIGASAQEIDGIIRDISKRTTDIMMSNGAEDERGTSEEPTTL